PRTLLHPSALLLARGSRSRRRLALLQGAASLAALLRFRALSALLRTRRLGCGLRRARRCAAGFATCGFRHLTAALFRPNAGLAFRATALPLFGRARLLALLCRTRRSGTLGLLLGGRLTWPPRLLRGAWSTGPLRLLGRARRTGPLRLLCRARRTGPLRLLGRARSSRLLASGLGRSSGQALPARCSGRGSRLTTGRSLTRKRGRMVAEPALLAGSQRRRRRDVRRGLNRCFAPLD